jgi:hypothetical protein
MLPRLDLELGIVVRELNAYVFTLDAIGTHGDMISLY